MGAGSDTCPAPPSRRGAPLPLRRLAIRAGGLGGPLPDIQPGAFPALESLELQFEQLNSTLPASWGGDPRVLPALRHLRLALGAAGPLPAAWARGFHRLAGLAITVGHMTGRQAVAGAAAPQPVGQQPGSAVADQPPRRLPPEWAAGFPALQSLHLLGAANGGSLPAAWQSGFPSLTVL